LKVLLVSVSVERSQRTRFSAELLQLGQLLDIQLPLQLTTFIAMAASGPGFEMGSGMAGHKPAVVIDNGTG
jgi:hypothetical protein